jgi:radical SAM superfamily enzyme YgiQ (UPF0313 family)
MCAVFLVNPPISNRVELYRQNRSSPPLGLAYISATLIENNINVAAIDMNVPFVDFSTLETRLGEEQPKIVGISAYTETYSNALRIARIAKRVNPEVVTVMGGPHVTFLPCNAVEVPEVDIAVRNEGEITMLELARYFRDGFGSLDEIKGVTFMRDGKCISTPPRPLISDLDSLPFPASHIFLLSQYQYPINISSARGCPYKCIFCAAEAMSGNSYRLRSPESVIDELTQSFERHRFQFFTFVDDTFSAFPDRTQRMCDLIKASDINVQWQCSTRIDSIAKNKDMLKRMADAGCKAVTYGVESGSQSILNSIKKGTTVEQVRKVVKWTLELGMNAYCSFMIPHPEDTVETVLQTKKLMVELLKAGAIVSISFTVPFPGTYLYEHMRELGVTALSKNWDDFSTSREPIISTKHLSLEAIKSLHNDIVSTLNEEQRELRENALKQIMPSP